MNITVDKSYFANELKLFQGIFEKKSLKDILENIKLTAREEGSLELVATDLEIGLFSTIPVTVNEPGTFTVNGRDLYELISRMPEGLVEITENNDLQILITNEKKTSKYKLLGLQSSDYPLLPEGDFSSPINISVKKLTSIINKSYYIISPEMKFSLGGALMTISHKKFELAATDSHRLAYLYYDSEFEMPETAGEDGLSFIVSRKTLLELLKICEEGDVQFTFDKNNLFFRYKNRILSSRIIDQKFPNYRAVIPDRTEIETIVNREQLLQVLRRILIFTTRNNGVVFNFADNRLILERTSSEKGEGHDEMEIDYNVNPINVAFNGNFIMDFLSHVETDNIQIDIIDEDSSFIFKPLIDSESQEEDVNFIYVVMPLNI
ncbi:MAG: DNA polymerase III subunit beta [Candidatus Aminicenantes bacterium]|nr:MAG: DNA polymerase III subunit beta [Candidatus Aminicenantes bacterium]